MILAQTDISTVGGQFEVFVERLVSLEGLVAALSGAALVVAIFSRSWGLQALASIIVLTMLMPPNFLSVFGLGNVLIGPFQLFRSLSRPIAYAVLFAASIRVLLVPPLTNRWSPNITAVTFLVFQLFFSTQVAFFDDGPKGVLGWFSILAMFIVFNVGLGRLMLDRRSASQVLEMFVWLSTTFVALNMIQLALGFSGAFVGGRFVGTGGNAQYTGFLCWLLMLTNLYFFLEQGEHRVPRLVLIGNTVALGAFLVVTGSRGNAIAATASVIMMFRLRLGKLIGVIIAAGMAVAAASLFGDEATGSRRFVEGVDTRTAVWVRALNDFAESPVFGNLALYGEERSSSRVESSMLRALASMGIIGGILLVIPAALMIRDALRSLRAARERPGLTDLHFALSGGLLLLNVYEGVAFGVLTLPVMMMYFCFALGSYLQAEATTTPDGEGLSPDPET